MKPFGSAYTEVQHNHYLDLRLDSDRVTIVRYRFQTKTNIGANTPGGIIAGAVWYNNSPAKVALRDTLPSVQHSVELHTPELSYGVIVDGAVIGRPDLVLIQQDMITFGLDDHPQMKAKGRDSYNVWYFPVKQGVLAKPVNWYVQSYIGKDSGLSADFEIVAQVAISRLNAPLDECAWRFNIDPRYGYRCNVPLEDHVPVSHDAFGAHNRKAFPQVLMPAQKTVSANGVLKIPVNVKNPGQGNWDHDFELYVETTGGYLPLTRYIYGKGKPPVKVRVHALHLIPGETFKVKVGSRFFTGIAETEVTVV